MTVETIYIHHILLDWSGERVGKRQRNPYSAGFLDLIISREAEHRELHQTDTRACLFFSTSWMVFLIRLPDGFFCWNTSLGQEHKQLATPSILSNLFNMAHYKHNQQILARCAPDTHATNATDICVFTPHFCSFHVSNYSFGNVGTPL